VHQLPCRGYTDVVGADLSKYFDTIPHRDLTRLRPGGRENGATPEGPSHRAPPRLYFFGEPDPSDRISIILAL
jgi:hypothetical protein